MSNKVRLVIVMHGGLVQYVVSETQELDIEIMTQDLDIEGAAGDELLVLSNDVEFVGTPVTIIPDPVRVKDCFNAKPYEDKNTTSVNSNTVK